MALSIRDKLKFFSFASAPDPARPGFFELAVGGTEEDQAPFREGASFDISPPQGRPALELGKPPTAVTMIAMGTGIAPLRATIQQLVALETPPPMTLLHGCRSGQELLFAAEFAELQAQGRPDYRPVLSRPDADWTGLKGRVQSHLDELLDSPGRFCVCGSLAMVESIEQLLSQAGVARERIFAQGY